ncbi:MAG: M48 family metallopeptidase [Candidatus Woesearchaeota archaeon]
METLYDRISVNKRSTYLLVFLFTCIIGFLGYMFGLYMGSPYVGLAVALTIAVALSLFSYFEGASAILELSGARLAKKENFSYLINTVEGLSIAAGIPAPKVYVIDEDSINAFATGRDPEHASIAVTTGALKKLNRSELEGVIAHEISHIKNYDIRLMMIVVILVGVAALLSDMILRTFIYGKGRRNAHENRGGVFFVVLLTAGLILAVLSPIIAQIIKFAISRRREYLADADGALLTRHPKALANALRKIKNDNDRIVDSANKVTAHLWIENPLRKYEGVINRMFSTHPPIEERIKILESM